MLSTQHRLSRTEFLTVFTQGKRIHKNFAQVIVFPHTTYKVSVVVSKKVSKKAVARNRIRRQLYTILRSPVQRHPGWYILLVKPTILEYTYTMLTTEITDMFGNMPRSS